MTSPYAARIRAARGFADLTQQQLADALGVEVQTIKRRESGTQEPKKGERLAIAHICGVPAEFMEDGFGGAANSELLTEVSQLGARFDAFAVDSGAHALEVSKQLSEALRQLADLRRRRRA